MKLKVLSSSSKGNCYLLDSGSEVLIIEAGIRFNDIMKGLNFDTSRVVGCLCSHSHLDHSKGVKMLQERFIPVYSSSGTFKALGLSGINITHLNKFNLGQFTVTPLNVIHDAPEPFSFIIDHEKMGKMVFCTDSAKFDYHVKGLNHLLIEANFAEDVVLDNLMNSHAYNSIERLKRSHMSLEQTKEVIQRHPNLTNIVLIHLSDRNSDAERFKRECQEVSGTPVKIAVEGLEIDL